GVEHRRRGLPETGPSLLPADAGAQRSRNAAAAQRAGGRRGRREVRPTPGRRDRRGGTGDYRAERGEGARAARGARAPRGGGGAATSGSVGGVVGPLLRNVLILSVFWVLLFFYRRETYARLRQVGTVAVLFACAILAAAAVARMAPQHAELILLPFSAMMLTV